MVNFKKIKMLIISVAALFVFWIGGNISASEVVPSMSENLTKNQNKLSESNFSISDSGVLLKYEGTLKEVVIPAGVKEISFNAFFSRNEIEKLILPEGLMAIDDNAFYGCTGLKEIIIPDSVETIGRLAFGNCQSVSRIYIGQNFKNLSELAFGDCHALSYIEVSDANKHFSDHGGLLYNKDTTVLIMCPVGIKGAVKLPDSVCDIKEYAFCNCAGVSKIIAGNNLNHVGEAAFYGCTGLKKARLGNNLNDIGAGAFMKCKSLTEFTVSEHAEAVGSSAFLKCTALEKIIFLSPSVKIGHKIFGKNKKVVVAGYKGSTAEAYAQKRNLTFNELAKN